MHSAPENLRASSNIIRSLGSVFISYSRKDYYFAESLTFSLIQRDVAAWLDVKDLRPGVDWEERLESAIDTASHLVLVASPDSLRSPHVTVEWKRALDRGIPVIVAHLRGNNVPPELAAMPRVNFHGRFKPAVNSLIEHLKGQADKPPAKRQLWPLPPIVGVTASLLLVMVGLTMFLADWGEITSGAAAGRSLHFRARDSFWGGRIFCLAHQHRVFKTAYGHDSTGGDSWLFRLRLRLPSTTAFQSSGGAGDFS